MKKHQATISAVGMAGMAIAAAAVIGSTPTLSTSPELLATLHYFRGTNIGFQPTDQQYEDFIGRVIDGTDTPSPAVPYEKVEYNAGFRPLSHGGFNDLTFDQSVQQGVDLLAAQNPAQGDVIFGFSQGAVAASMYKGTHTGNTYVLVGNPSRPNGGIFERFEGLKIPFLDVTFSGPTPNNGVDDAPGDPTIDVARQYDGYADFPTYLANPVALANALLGILFVHGNTQFDLTAEDLEEAKASGNSDYYQQDAASNTTYYLVKTYPVPLLIPFDKILPAPVIAALDAPLRRVIERAYDRSDYAAPTRARLFPPRTRELDADVSTVAAKRDNEDADVSSESKDADRSRDAVTPERTPVDRRAAARAETGDAARAETGDADGPDPDTADRHSATRRGLGSLRNGHIGRGSSGRDKVRASATAHADDTAGSGDTP